MQSLLRELLDLGLIDVGENDAWYDFLEEASGKLGQHYGKQPTTVVPALLVALDDDAAEDEPSFQQAEDVLREKWKGLRSRFKDRPRPLLRILIFDALHRAAGQSVSVAAALWLTAESIFPHFRLGRERAPVERILLGYAEQMEQKAVELEDGWQGKQAAAPPKLMSIKLPPAVRLNGNVVNIYQFMELMRAAFTSTQPASFQTAHPPNNDFGPNAFSLQQNPHWSIAASSRLNEILTRAINTGVQGLADQVEGHLASLTTALQQTMDQQAAELSTSAETLYKHQLTRSQSAQLKTDVLWWLESLYSQSLRRSFRSLSPPVAAVSMAYDLFGSISARLPTPTSVIHVIGEAVNRLPDAGYNRRYPLRELLREIREHHEPIQTLIEATKSNKGRPKAINGRRPLLSVIESTVLHALPAEGEVQAQTGLVTDISVSLPELAMWCFRDLAARHLCKGQGAA